MARSTKQKLKKKVAIPTIKPLITIPKRVRLLISTVGMTGVMLGLTFFDFSFLWLSLLIILLAVYIFVYLSVFEGIRGIQYITVFILPILLAVSMYSFYFIFFPVRWLTRFPFIAIYSISAYATMLCSNIFSVGAEKNLQLYRAAFSVNILFQTFILFMGLQVVASLRLPFIFNGIISSLIVFPLSVQLLWSVKPQEAISRDQLMLSFFISLVVLQVSIFLSFIPIQLAIYSLFITVTYYCVSGLLYHFFDNKLFKQTIREYLLVFAFICVITILTM